MPPEGRLNTDSRGVRPPSFFGPPEIPVPPVMNSISSMDTRPIPPKPPVGPPPNPSNPIIWKGTVKPASTSNLCEFQLYLQYLGGDKIEKLPLPRQYQLPCKGRLSFDNLAKHLPIFKKKRKTSNPCWR